MIKTWPSNTGGAGQGAKILRALGPKNQNIKQKQHCNKFNKYFKNGPHRKKKKIKKKKLYLSHTEDYNPEASIPDNSEELLWRSVVSAQFYIWSEQRTLNGSEIHAFKVSKTQHPHSESSWPWHLGRESYHQRSTCLGTPGRKAFNLLLT